MIEAQIGLPLFVIALLLEGLMAAARSALVHSRPSELLRLAQATTPGAERAHQVAEESTRYLISLRIALNLLRILAIGLAIAALSSLRALDLGSLALGLAGSGLLMGLFELAGESLARRQPEAWAIRTGSLVALLVVVLAPAGQLLLRLAGEFAGSVDGPQHPMVTEQEIMTLVDAGEEGGSIEQDEKAMIYSIFRLDDTLAREVMVPRIDVLGFEQTASIEEATDVLLRTGYSRAPVYRESIDDVVGLVYVKDLLGAWREGRKEGQIRALMRPAYFVPEAKKVDDLLEAMQVQRIHLAIVVDEYGGTAGLVTIEDIVEEIIGEIRDEYDFAEEARYQRSEDGEFIFSGGIDLDDVNQIADADLPKHAGETLGGFIYSELGRVPSAGDRLVSGGLELTVDQVVRRRIRRVRARHVGGARGSQSGAAGNGSGAGEVDAER